MGTGEGWMSGVLSYTILYLPTHLHYTQPAIDLPASPARSSSILPAPLAWPWSKSLRQPAFTFLTLPKKL